MLSYDAAHVMVDLLHTDDGVIWSKVFLALAIAAAAPKLNHTPITEMKCDLFCAHVARLAALPLRV